MSSPSSKPADVVSIVAPLWPSSTELVDLLARCQERLDLTLRTTTLDPAAATRLPDWTIGHLLSHLARNADSVVRRLTAAREGRGVTQYPGGLEMRARDIEVGSTRPFAELVDDVLRSSIAVMDAARELKGDTWNVLSTTSFGLEQSAAVVVQRRVIEVELHHCDIGTGYGPSNWPPVLVEHLLVECLDRFADPSQRASLAAWMTGRGPAPEPPNF
jgi:maleylpyruvate isomerase